MASYERQGGGRIGILFANGPKVFTYGPERVQVLRGSRAHDLAATERVEVDGTLWETATEIRAFPGGWTRVFYTSGGTEKYGTYPADQVRVVSSATAVTRSAAVLRYWQDVVSRLPQTDPLRQAFGRLDFVHPESALASFLAGAPIRSTSPDHPPIFPFRCNISQRQAVDNALTSTLSVIEGPPGTGKTETILNLVANLVAVGHKTVGIVSFNNAAVDNVRDKLDELGFGHVLGDLGNKEKKEAFFAAQADRNTTVRRFVARAPQPPDLDRLAKVDRRLRGLQEAERVRADRRQALDAYRLEFRHFEQHLGRAQLPDLDSLPLLKKSADRILDYLAETQWELAGARPGPLRRIRQYFERRSIRHLDPSDTDVVLRLQLAYYTKRIAELEWEVEQADDRLRCGDFDRLAWEHQQLSVQFLHTELAELYRKPRIVHDPKSYRRGPAFADFMADYPAVLSTCHSLGASLADGYLLDYLIIDEASQVNLLVAALALACARAVIVVGDQKQLAPVKIDDAGRTPPMPAYDCQRNLLSALAELYGRGLPSTLLREHYRCDPMIIGFCNKKFYDGELIPYTSGGAERPMIVVRTAEGNHMRKPHGGGAFNQRELDVIAQEVIRDHCAGFADRDIGVTTPYRLQADRAADLLDRHEADTVHKFQGRQKEVVILSTVVSENRDGHIGLRFVDVPQLVNVAVSRAVRRFILVTNHDMMPRSRHFRDLVGYIRYHDPEHEVVDSEVVSVFDLLYKNYSRRVEHLARRLGRTRAQHRSEGIIRIVLRDILAEPSYAHLTVVEQVLLWSLVPTDPDRLTDDQRTYLGNRASVDFVVYNRITNQALLAVEVDGFAFHSNDTRQLARDVMKNAILEAYEMPLLRLPTTESAVSDRIRQALDRAEAHWAARPVV
ncbi:MAG TPA: AAA domain-containing protein [Kutzneria sp.]|nr:AAA domain-containing protein [Kutzneria sp.]